MVYEVSEIPEVWRNHYSSLSTPKDDISYDSAHFDTVNKEVNELKKRDDNSPFLETPFTTNEVQRAVNRLKSNKAYGYDRIGAEHVKYGGYMLTITLTMIFNLINQWEYVPLNFKRGIQVPLFKGKNLRSADTNNYRGITLLSIFSKVYEMIIWARLEPWWKENNVISKFQGACCKGQSCVHTSLLLQESVASALETHDKVFVSYFDVSKAFDTVWMNGLFSKLHDMGIRGKLWRLMYRTYTGFHCRVRVAGSFSDWYPMSCGIHQGGVLSLVKYLVFIDELLVKLEKSNLCCKIDHIPSSPAGYADDLATATVSEMRTDMVHDMVYEYGKKWRFKPPNQL